MAKKALLNATKRQTSGSAAAKRLRRQGILPGVIYGAQQDNYSIQLKEKEFADLLHHSASENVLVTLCIEGAREPEKLAMVQSVQHDPLSGAVLHVDFHAVREDEELTAAVPLELLGEPAGVKMGGILDHPLHTVEVRCMPANLPEKLSLDVSALEIGQAKHASDIPLPAGVTLAIDGDVVVASVQEVKELVVAEVAPAAPEVIGEVPGAAEGSAAAPEAAGKS